MPDTVFSGRFYYKQKFQELYVGVTDGKISEITKSNTGAKIIYLPYAVLPSGIDIHVHFRDPGETSKEDFKSGSISAIYGGTTTVFDMPNNLVPVSDYDVFENKLNAVSTRSFCDFGLYSLYNGKNKDVIDKRSSGLKVYLGGSTNALPIGEMDKVAKEHLANWEKPVLFHSEDSACLKSNTRLEKNCRDHNLARPVECEEAGVKSAISFAARKGIIGHLSHSSPLDSNYKVEVTPHHLLLNDDKITDQWGKVNPPLRDRATQEQLLGNYLSGKYQILSSDHGPHTEEDKADFQHAASGIIGVETRIPLMLNLVKNKILNLDILLSTAVITPGETFDIGKGQIEIGYSADFMCVDFSNVSRLNQEKLHSKVTISPFNGFDVIFPSHVVISGNVAIDQYELVEERFGKFVQAGDQGKKTET